MNEFRFVSEKGDPKPHKENNKMIFISIENTKS